MFLEVIVLSIFLIFSNGQIPEGEPCTNDGAQGTCRNIRFCPSITLVDLKLPQKKHPTICSYEGNTPIVCCTDCYPADVTKAVVTLDGVLLKPGTNKSFDQCLDFISTLPYSCKNGLRISVTKKYDNQKKCHYMDLNRQYSLIGELAKRGEFPHMALVGYGDTMETAQWLCGGSIISKNFILTAGHCGHHPTLGPVTFVALGILKRSDPADLWQRYKVRRFISHPEYRPPSKYNDIALIETEADISFSINVLPICVGHRDMAVSEAQAEGWGAEGHKQGNSDGLRKALLESFSKEECDGIYPPHRLQTNGVDHNTQFCYGDHKENKDTCQGDSGGPLQAYGGRQCIQYVIGVTSYGRACGQTGGAGIYTKVWPYLAWIESHVWP